MVKSAFWAIVPAFIAGLLFGTISGKNSADKQVYAAGYDAAMNHVTRVIRQKMGELSPFYLADLGIKFIPRGNNVAAIRFVSDPASSLLTPHASPSSQEVDTCN